jgi:MYXO-CTERM domain-containing protein
MIPKLAGSLFGAAIALTSATALAQIYSLEVHDGDNAGTAYPGENERRNNNNQLGAGIEHVRCGVLKAAPGGPRLLCMGTASYTDIPDSPVQDRIQGLCISHRIDPMAGPVRTAMKYVTNNRGDQRQNAHAPVVAPVFGGTAAAVYYNYDPDNNTRLYGKILGPDCEELTPQTQLFAQNNDNVLGHAYNPVVVADSPDETRLGSCGIGNGNGRDDMWCLGVRAKKSVDGYTIERYFAASVEAEEERSRPAVMPTTIPDHILECSAVGNTQPPNRGTRCALVNTAPNTPNDQRVVWRKYIEQREGEIYRTTPSLAPMLDAQGNVTDTYVVTYVEVDTSNRRNRSKGATYLKVVPVKVTLDDLELLDTPKYDMAGFGDQAHQYSCATLWGPEARPTAVVIQGSIVGSTTGVGRASILGYDASTRRASNLQDLVFQDSTDTGWIAQYYGNNPNTPQGRNHHDCFMMSNPGYGVAGGFQSNVKEFLFIANTGRKLRTDGVAQDKMAFDLVFVPAVVPSVTEPQPEPEPDPEDPGEPSPEPTEPDDVDGPSNSLGGCSTTGTTGSGTLLVLGLAFGLAIRRRRAA